LGDSGQLDVLGTSSSAGCPPHSKPSTPGHPAGAQDGRFPSSPLQFIERDRQVAYTLAGRVIDRVGDRRGDADDANLAQPLDAEWIDDLVRLVDEDHLGVVYVGVHRDMVFGNV